MALIWKNGYTFDLLFTFFSQTEKVHISLTCIHVCCSPYILAFPVLQKLQIRFVWFLFGATLVLIHIRATLKRSINNKRVSKTEVGMYYWYLFTLMQKKKTLNLNGGRWRLSSIQKTKNKQTKRTNKQTYKKQSKNNNNNNNNKNQCFLAAVIFLFIG